MDAANAILDPVAPSLAEVLSLARADMARVDRLIGERLQSQVPVIPALADHLIEAGGKRFRPLVAICAAHLVGGPMEAPIRLAAAVEFVHTAALLHDDVVDGSRLRRGRVAAHLIWGAPQSLLVGDYLFARAFELMIEAGSMQALEIMARASRVIAEGEVLQLSRTHDLEVAEATYLAIITAKTAELFAAAAEAGAVTAGADCEKAAALRAYGLDLGLAFQLADDALDYDGATETLGKTAGDDFREGKATLPLLLARARAGRAEEAFFARTVASGRQDDGDFSHIQAIVRRTGALEATFDRARRYAKSARARLAPFPHGPWRAALEALADFAVSRRA